MALLCICLAAVPLMQRHEDMTEGESRVERSAVDSAEKTAKVVKRDSAAESEPGAGDYPGFDGGNRRWYG